MPAHLSDGASLTAHTWVRNQDTMTLDPTNAPPGGKEGGNPTYVSPRAEPRRITPRSPRAALEPERLPEPKRASSRVRHPLVIIGNIIFTLFLLLVIIVGLGYAAVRQRLDVPGPLASERVVNIPRGLGKREIADLLNREGVIEQPLMFVASVLLREDLKYGEYQFPRRASLHEVIDTIVEGKVVQHQVTIAEGLTSEQIVAKLLENDVLTGNIKEIPKEGTLLPETYRFTRGMSREQIIQRMQQTQRELVQRIWERRAADLPLRTPEQFVVLASIVEKETGKPDERSRVAAVFVNRLRQKMKLQSDPTIIYGLMGGKGTLGRPILRSEIEQPTPYNTYVIDGLPPGPICNPGRASLEATANPARTRDLYFVADGTGGHAFAEKLEDHQKNVQRLRALEQQTREALTPAAADPAATQAPAGATTAQPITPPPPSTPPARAPQRLPRNGKAQSTTTPPGTIPQQTPNTVRTQ